jgi:hypothetical protein
VGAMGTYAHSRCLKSCSRDIYVILLAGTPQWCPECNFLTCFLRLEMAEAVHLAQTREPLNDFHLLNQTPANIIRWMNMYQMLQVGYSDFYDMTHWRRKMCEGL